MATDTTASIPLTVGVYELLVKIAEGGMGAVYKARSQQTGDVVAIKIIPSETAKNPVLLKRFEQEFKAASLLDHPNVVKAIEYCASGPNPFLVMEFVDGQSLGRRVEKDGPLNEEFALQIMAQVCDGLHRAHKQGMIHRDVKPDNIIVTADGVAKLTDLGLVKDVEGELNLTRTGRGLGTPHFMAPEQFRNAKNADVRCDIYSLGATLYMLLTGVVPFAKTSPLDCWMRKIKNDFPPPQKVNAAISERVNWAVLRAMSAEPSQRPNSCREFLEDLNGQAWQGWSTLKGDAAPSTGVVQPGTRSGVSAAPGDLWYLVYKGPDGVQQKVKGTTDSIRQNVKTYQLGDPGAIIVCRTKQGPFTPLKNTPEFRDLVVGPQAVDASKITGRHTPTATSDTGRSFATVPQNSPPPRTPKADPESYVLTEEHSVKPLQSKRSLRAEDKSARNAGTVDSTTWLIAGMLVAAATIGVILWMSLNR